MPYEPRGVFWDDLALGTEFWSSGRTVTEGDITAFAALSGDFNPLHMDAELAKSTPFGERVPHGPLGLLFAMGSLDRIGLLEGVGLAFLELDWKFRAPARVGDTLSAHVTVKELRATRDPSRGIAIYAIELIKQGGHVVQEGNLTFLVKRCPAVDAVVVRE